MSYEIRSLTLAELLDTAFQLLRDRFVLLCGLAAIVQAPIAVVLGPLMSDPRALSLLGDEAALALVALLLVYLVLMLLAFPVVAAAITRAVGDVYLGWRAGWGRALAAGLRRLVPLLLTFLLFSLVALAAAVLAFGVVGAVMLGAMALVGPDSSVALFVTTLVVSAAVGFVYYLYVITPFAVLTQVVVLEDVAFFDAIVRAFQVVAGHRLRVVGVLLVAGVLVTIPVSGLGLVGTAWPWVGAVLSAVGQSIGFAFTSAAGVLLYFDLRCRKEGFDLEHLARMVEARAAEAEAREPA